MQEHVHNQATIQRAAKLQEDLAGLVQVIIGGLGQRLASLGVSTIEFTILSLCASSQGQIHFAPPQRRDRVVHGD